MHFIVKCFVNINRVVILVLFIIQGCEFICGGHRRAVSDVNPTWATDTLVGLGSRYCGQYGDESSAVKSLHVGGLGSDLRN
ncbi:hypothetical protein EYZ11_013241 [Aspergillus tanneri]|uniref:Uncharacterized protein n=1 Tax=Aspergillus tanneri TaxID=1220188 RepID=A0A4V3UMH2_9EURO|nr:hypothetical protein EYZ11_013241 [Aspergillus tanneri]